MTLQETQNLQINLNNIPCLHSREKKRHELDISNCLR